MERAVLRIMTRLFHSCDEATRLVSEGMDRSLSLGQRLRLRMHLLMCRICERYRGQLIFLRDAVRRDPDRLLEDDSAENPSLPPESRQRLKDVISRQGT